MDHFAIKSRDWESGEKSVFGQAVNCLLDEILQNKQQEVKTLIKRATIKEALHTTFV